MIERLLLVLERWLRRPAPRVTDERYPVQHWRIVQPPHDQDRER